MQHGGISDLIVGNRKARRAACTALGIRGQLREDLCDGDEGLRRETMADRFLPFCLRPDGGLRWVVETACGQPLTLPVEIAPSDVADLTATVGRDGTHQFTAAPPTPFMNPVDLIDYRSRLDRLAVVLPSLTNIPDLARLILMPAALPGSMLSGAALGRAWVQIASRHEGH